MAKIDGAHAILYSKDSEADRAFLKDVLRLPSVEVGEGWLIFALPPAEVAVHPAEKSGTHELYLMTDDVAGLIEELARRDVTCSPARNLGWGMLTQVTLPGGGVLGIYQPRHARPKWSEPVPRPSRRPPARRARPRGTSARQAPAKRRRTPARRG